MKASFGNDAATTRLTFAIGNLSASPILTRETAAGNFKFCMVKKYFEWSNCNSKSVGMTEVLDLFSYGQIEAFLESQNEKKTELNSKDTLTSSQPLSRLY